MQRSFSGTGMLPPARSLFGGLVLLAAPLVLFWFLSFPKDVTPPIAVRAKSGPRYDPAETLSYPPTKVFLDKDGFVSLPAMHNQDVHDLDNVMSRCGVAITKALIAWHTIGVRDINLVIYRYSDPSDLLSGQAQINNALIFANSVNYSDPAFYILFRSRRWTPATRMKLFTSGSGLREPREMRMATSRLRTELKDHLCEAEAPYEAYEVSPALLFLARMGDQLQHFTSIILLSQQVRGPMTHRANGEWIRKFSDLAHSQKDVAVAGPRHYCHSKSIYLPLHAIAINTALLPLILIYELAISIEEVSKRDYYNSHIEPERLSNYRQYWEHGVVGLSRFLVMSGFHLASMGKATETGNGLLRADTACEPTGPSEGEIFYNYGGAPAFRLCNFTGFDFVEEGETDLDVSLVHTLTKKLQAREPLLPLKQEDSICKMAISRPLTSGAVKAEVAADSATAAAINSKGRFSVLKTMMDKKSV